jgi:PKD repeat protein
MKKIIPFLIALLLLLTFLSTVQAQFIHDTLPQNNNKQTLQEHYTSLIQNRQTIRSRIHNLRSLLQSILSPQHQNTQPYTALNQQTNTQQQNPKPLFSTPLQQPMAPLTNSETEFPPIWDIPINTGTVMGSIIMLEANPRINDIPLQPGDWIAGFYLDDNGERKCGGARMWTGDVNRIISLFGNDGTTPEKDGFSGGELIEYRFFSWTTQKEYLITSMTYHVELGWVSNGRWYPTSLSKALDMKASVSFDAYLSTSPNPICLGDSAQLQAHIFVESTGTYTYSWSSDPSGFTSNLQTPPPVSPTQTTIYKLNVSDGIQYSTHELPLVVHVNPASSAGDDAVICENMNHQLQGSAENYSEILWTTSGDGSFSNPSILNPVYTPGVADKESGEVTLSITAIPLSPCSIAATDSIILSVSALPSVDAGEDFSVCTNEPAILNAVATDYSSLLWTTSGSGTFSDPHSLESIYYPSDTDVNSGQIFLTITASAVSPCTPPVSDTVKAFFIPGPTVSAPNVIRRCEDKTISVICVPYHYSSVLWTTPGDGYFEDPTMKSTVYHPGPNDISNGGLFITVYAFGQGPCSVPASKDVQLVIVNLPTVNAGEDTQMNAADSYIELVGAATNYSSIVWSKYGDGFFTSTTNLNTKYYPGSLDRAAGEFTLILTASPLTHCTIPISDEIHITIIDEQLPDAPLLSSIPDQSITANQQYSYQVHIESSDPEETIAFALLEHPNDMTIHSSNGLISWLAEPTDVGVHSITVKVYYNNYPELYDTTSYTLTVEAENLLPLANFSYTPESPLVDEIIQFTDLSMDPDGTVVGWSWVFGDGGSSTLQHPTHVYSSEGAYMVSLTVTDDDGATDTIAKEIIVEKDDSHSIVVQYHLSKGVNFISFDFLPDSLYIEDIFAPLILSGDLIMIIADNAIGGYFMPAWNINALGNNGQVELYRGYRVIIKQDTVLSVSGQQCVDSATLDLVTGANFVSFKNETAVFDAVGDLFNNDSITMIIDLSNSHNPPLYLKKLNTGIFIGDLEVFQPGTVYLFLMNNNCTLNVT